MAEEYVLPPGKLEALIKKFDENLLKAVDNPKKAGTGPLRKFDVTIKQESMGSAFSGNITRLEDGAVLAEVSGSFKRFGMNRSGETRVRILLPDPELIKALKEVGAREVKPIKTGKAIAQ